MTEAHFFSSSPGYHPFDGGDDVLCGSGNALDVFVPLANTYSIAAQKFGDILANNSNAERLRQKLQLYGYLINRVGSYERPSGAAAGGVIVGGSWFPRVVTAIVRVSKPDNTVCGYLIRSIWLEGSAADEDGDMEDAKNTEHKKQILMDRKCNRNPNYALYNLFELTTHGKFKEQAKFSPYLWFHNLTREKYVREFAAHIVTVEDHDLAMRCHSLRDMNSANPTKVSNVFSLRVAIAEMKLSGCDARFVNEAAYANNDLDFHGGEIWRVDPKEMVWGRLQSTFFPDHPLPVIDTNSPEFQYALQLRAGTIFEEVAPEARGGSPEEQKLFKDECMRKAGRDVLRAFRAAVHIKLETANRDLLAAANEKRIADAIAAAKVHQAGDTPSVVADRIGLARYRAQCECLEALDVLLQQDASLDQSYVAVREHMAKFLNENNGSLYWEHEWSPHLSNLTEFGKMMALFNLWSEADGCYMVHRQTLTVWLAALHVPFRAKMQPNLLIVGKFALGKSRALQVGAQSRLIPNTWKGVSGSSDKSDLSATGAFLQNNKVKVCEEMPPSDLGLENNNNRKYGSTAMTDKSSRFRASATDDGKIGYERLVKNEETGRFDLESLDIQLNRVLLGCLNLQPHEIPGNVLSRFICLQFMQYQRSGQYQMTSCKLYKVPSEFQPSLETATKRFQWIQMLAWMFALVLRVKAVKTPSFTVTQLFIEEVILLAKERGVNGVSDYRILDHIHSLIEMVAIINVLWSYFSKPGSKIANLLYDKKQWIEVEKAMMPKVEHAVFILSLLSDQFENSVATEVLSAISVHFKTSPYHKQAYARWLQRRKGSDNGAEHSDDEGVMDVGQDGAAGAFGAPAAGSEDIKVHLSNYYDFQIDVGRIDNLRANERLDHLCNKLAEIIEDKFIDKPERASVTHYLHALTTQTVATQDRKMNIPCLMLKDTGHCSIAKVMLHNLTTNRLVACLQEVLSRGFYPEQRYVLGVPTSEAPYLWKTFSTNPLDLPTEFEKKRYKTLKAHARSVRIDQLKSLNLSDAEKKAFLASPDTIRYCFAAHEKAIWNAVSERKSENHVLFKEGTQFQHLVQRIDIDREDIGAIEWLGKEVYMTSSVARQFQCFKSAKDLQPSLRRAAENKEHAATVARMVLIEQKQRPLTSAQLKQITDRCRYPVCFESRKPTEFRHQAIAHAVQNPHEFSLKVQASEMVQTYGLDFDMGGVVVVEHKQQQQPAQESKYRRPVERPRSPTPPPSPRPEEEEQRPQQQQQEESDVIHELLMQADAQELKGEQQQQQSAPFVLEQDDTSLPYGGIPLRQYSSGANAMETQPPPSPEKKKEAQPRAAPNTPNRKKRPRDETDSALSNKRLKPPALLQQQPFPLPPGRVLSSYVPDSQPALVIGVKAKNKGPSGSLFDAFKIMQAEQDDDRVPMDVGAAAAAEAAVENKSSSSSSSSNNAPPPQEDPSSMTASSSSSPGKRRSGRKSATDREERKRRSELNKLLAHESDDENDDDFDVDADSDEQADEEAAILAGYAPWDKMDEVDSEEERDRNGEDVVGEGEAALTSPAELKAERKAAKAIAAAEERAELAAAKRRNAELRARKAAKSMETS